MRRRLNAAFKEFCLKLEKVATTTTTPTVVTPFVKSSFDANVHCEMVRVMPTTHCLINLTETPNCHHQRHRTRALRAQASPPRPSTSC